MPTLQGNFGGAVIKSNGLAGCVRLLGAVRLSSVCTFLSVRLGGRAGLARGFSVS